MTPLLPALALLSTISSQAGTWARPEDFKGKKILIACYYYEGEGKEAVPMNQVPAVLRKLGFTVDLLRTPEHLPDMAKLAPYDQLWIVSGSGSTFDESDARKVKTFLGMNKGVYIMADNEPYTAEANVVGKFLHGINFSGGYMGDKTINVVSHGEMKKLIDQAMKAEDSDKLAEYRRAGWFNGKLYAEDHEILTGIRQIYEGITVSTMSGAAELEVIIRASDNQPLVSISTEPSQRIIYDGGFTRLYWQWSEHEAINQLWYRNIAAYLLGKTRTDLVRAP